MSINDVQSVVNSYLTVVLTDRIWLGVRNMEGSDLCLIKDVIPVFAYTVLPLTEHHAMKAYWGIGGTAPPIL
jgi:hypothetical protein